MNFEKALIYVLRRIREKMIFIVLNFAFLTNFKIKVNDYWIRPFTLDLFIMREIFNHNVYKFIPKPNNLVIDMGACIGFFSFLCAKNRANVISFEPVKENISLFKFNLEQSGLLNRITLYEKAIWINNGFKDMFIPRNKVNSSFYKFINSKIVKVETIDINDVVTGQRIDFLKMDIEGAEYDVINKTDLINVEQIGIEYHACLPELATKIPILINRLKELGFKVNVEKELNLSGYVRGYRDELRVNQK